MTDIMHALTTLSLLAEKYRFRPVELMETYEDYAGALAIHMAPAILAEAIEIRLHMDRCTTCGQTP